LILGFAFLVLSGCAQKGAESPKDAVIKLFGAMERNDKAAIAHLLDIPALMSIRDEDYALSNDNPRVFHNPMDILDDLTGLGLTKTRWFSMQRVIGQTEMVRDTAFVEVSFINKNTNIQYYNKFGLHLANDLWKIYSFKTVSSNK
jgi:hypothetical protein